MLLIKEINDRLEYIEITKSIFDIKMKNDDKKLFDQNFDKYILYKRKAEILIWLKARLSFEEKPIDDIIKDKISELKDENKHWEQIAKDGDNSASEYIRNNIVQIEELNTLLNGNNNNKYCILSVNQIKIILNIIYNQKSLTEEEKNNLIKALENSLNSKFE